VLRLLLQPAADAVAFALVVAVALLAAAASAASASTATAVAASHAAFSSALRLPPRKTAAAGERDRRARPMYIGPTPNVRAFAQNGSMEASVQRAWGLPLCRQNQHVWGDWVAGVGHPWKKSYYCCADNDYKLSAAQCGSSTPIGDPSWGSNTHPLQTRAHSCQCDLMLGKEVVHDREKYKWFPHDCQLMQWSATHFCELLGTRYLLFAGDSTVKQSFYSLDAQVLAGKGGCAHRLGFTFLYDRKKFGDTVLNISRPTVVVLGWGAHALHTQDMRAFLDYLDRDIVNNPVLLERQRKEVSFLWRTNHPGHYHCDKAITALHSSQWNVNVSSGSSNETDHYRYAQFPAWDAMCTQWAQNRTTPIPVLDMRPLYGRPDAHPALSVDRGVQINDCLHSCLPGPMDMGANILLQMLYNKEI
jgi:hypothetical protein